MLGLTDTGAFVTESASAIHRLILEAAARGRARGALQADCAKAACVPNNNFFYQVTRLEARGLLQRAAVTLKQTAGQSGAVRFVSFLRLL